MWGRRDKQTSGSSWLVSLGMGAPPYSCGEVARAQQSQHATHSEWGLGRQGSPSPFCTQQGHQQQESRMRNTETCSSRKTALCPRAGDSEPCHLEGLPQLAELGGGSDDFPSIQIPQTFAILKISIDFLEYALLHLLCALRTVSGSCKCLAFQRQFPPVSAGRSPRAPRPAHK